MKNKALIIIKTNNNKNTISNKTPFNNETLLVIKSILEIKH